MSESVLAASGFSLVSLWFQAEKGTLSPLECLSFANTIQADLPTCAWKPSYRIQFNLFQFFPKKIIFFKYNTQYILHVSYLIITNFSLSIHNILSITAKFFFLSKWLFYSMEFQNLCPIFANLCEYKNFLKI